MLKVVIGALLLLYVIALIYFAFRELSTSTVEVEVDCKGEHRIVDSMAITGYMEKSLLDKILQNLSNLLQSRNPRKVFIGETDENALNRGMLRDMGEIYILYKTTSRDYVEQVLGAMEELLKSRGFVNVERRRVLSGTGTTYFYIFAGFC